MQVPGEGGGPGEPIYVIGSFERRVTLYSQQVRALNLAYALFETRRLSRGAKVAVIGGGAAGVTAALGLAHLGAEVQLIERADVLLPLQHGCRTRWIHPHIYDWPKPGAEDDDADLPLANWRAGYAHDVASELTSAIEPRASIHLTLSASLNSLSALGGKARLSWKGLSPAGIKITRTDVELDAVLLAVGFGVEEGSDALPMSSYWRNDDLDQPVLRRGPDRVRYLVSGNGDGGLIEVLRLRLRRFRLEELHRILRDSLQPAEFEDLTKQLRGWENEAADRGDAWLWERYESLQVPAKLVSELKRMLRSDTKVWLAAQRAPITARSAVLNRLWVALLIKHDGDTTWVPSATKTVVKERATCTVEFTDPDAADASTSFDRVVVRHGPTIALAGKLQWVAERCKDLRARNVLDATRVPIWPAGAFDAPPAGNLETVQPPSALEPIARSASVIQPGKPPHHGAAQARGPGGAPRLVIRNATATSPLALFQALMDAPEMRTAMTTATAAPRLDVTSAIREIVFLDSCIVDKESVEQATENPKAALFWHWDLRIRVPLEYVMRDTAQLGIGYDELKGYFLDEEHELSAPAYAQPLFRNLEQLVRTEQAITNGLGRLWKFLGDQSHHHRILAVSNFATFAALQMMARVRAFDGMLITEDHLRIVDLFPEYPPFATPWLLARVPYRSQTGIYAFGVKSWLLAHVAVGNGDTKQFLLPKDDAMEALGTSRGLSADAIATWIVPQWFLHHYDGTPQGPAVVTTLVDELGREHTDRSHPPPWPDELLQDEKAHPSRSMLGLKRVALEPDWHVLVQPTNQRGPVTD